MAAKKQAKRTTTRKAAPAKTKVAKAKPVEAKVVEAVGTATAGPAQGGVSLSKRLEDAMVQATLDAAKDGVTDPDEVRRRKLEARDRAKEEWRKETGSS